jgi:hypothetical protein
MPAAQRLTACPVAGRRRHRNATRQKFKSDSSIDRSPWALKIFPLRDGYGDFISYTARARRPVLARPHMRRDATAQSASELAFRLHMASCQVVPVGSPSRLCMARSGGTSIPGLSAGNVKFVKIENT